MLKMVDGTGIIGVDMICPLGVSTPQPPNYDRVELEGTGMLVLPNSLDTPLERLELGGKTEQVQTSGKQLFDASRYEGVTKNGVTVTVKDGVITATGTPNTNTWIQVFVSRENYQKLFKPENKIYLKTNRSKDCNYDFGIYGSFGSPIIGTIREGNSGRVLPAELPRNDTDFYFFIDTKIGTELKGSIKPIVYHDGDGTWEPYTGGKPSPSPEYPQEIVNAGKLNVDTQKHEVDVKITGKNLFDKEYAKDKSNWIKGFQENYSDLLFYVGKGKKVTFSTNKKLELGLGFFLCVADDSGQYAKDWLYSSSRGEQIKEVVTITSKNEYVILRCTTKNIPDFIEHIPELQIEISEIKTNYEPYKEQTLTLTSDRPITKWDKLIEQGGEIGWLYKSKTATITGKEHYSAPSESYYSGTSTDMYTVDFGLFIKGGEYCNRLQRIDGIWDSSNINNIGFTTNGSNQIHIRIYNSLLNVSDNATKEEKVAAFKTYLTKEYENGNPYIVIFQTKDTEFVPLPQSEQNAIRALKTYYPTTVITADGGELDPDVKVTYRKEI